MEKHKPKHKESDRFYLNLLSHTLKTKEQPSNEDVKKFQIKVNQMRKQADPFMSDEDVESWNPADGMMRLDGKGATWGAINWWDGYEEKLKQDETFETLKKTRDEYFSKPWYERPDRIW